MSWSLRQTRRGSDSSVDADHNGLDDAYETTPGSGEGLTAIDSNADGTLEGTAAALDAATITALEGETGDITGSAADGDTIVLADGAALTLNLTLVDDGDISGIERIDIIGDDANTLTLEEIDLSSLSGTSNKLLVLAGSDDTVNASGFTDMSLTREIEGQPYTAYTSGGATLLVDEDATVVI